MSTVKEPIYRLAFDTEGSEQRPEKAGAVQGVYFAEPISSVSAGVFRVSIGHFGHHYRELDNLDLLQPNWNSHGAEPPNASALTNARTALDILVAMSFLPTKIAPSAEGGIGISFLVAERYADIEFLNTGEILAVISDPQSDPVVWEVTASRTGVRQAFERIQEFFHA